MSNEHRGRRCKILYLGHSFLEDVLSHFRGASVIECPVFPELPKDYEIVGVAYQLNRQAWAVCIRHDSFDCVPDWEVYPVIKSGKVVIFEKIPNMVETS